MPPRIAQRPPAARLATWLAAAVLAVLPGPLFADLWYEHYTTAQEALEDERWSDAIEEINSALEKKGDSGARARTYGMRFIAYFPYLDLGIAYYNLGQLEAALQAFETEEQLGAVTESPAGLAKLRDFREATLEKQRLIREEESRRIANIVSAGLGEAETLERKGELDEALAAIGSALAVAPDNADAQAALERLRGEIARRQEAEDLQRRVDALVERARGLLDRGDLAQGSGLLRQALALQEDPAARRLLDQAAGLLRTQLRPEAEERDAAVAAGLAEAAALERAGELDAASAALAKVLALDPSNEAGLEMEFRLLLTRGERDRARSEQLRLESISGFLAQAENALAEGRFEKALAAANRVLALDAGHGEALAQLARAYRGINVRLLGGSQRQNFPPAIRFVDQRHEHEDSLAELVDRPDFRLSGVVIDDAPVTIAFFDGETEVEGSHSSQLAGELYITSFQLSRRLPEGPSTIRLLATDSESLRSSAEYAVIYQRPPWRSPALWATAGGVLVAGAGLLVAGRARRLRRLRRRRFNPYMAGAPVLDEKLFFGRERLIERILQTLHNNSLLLHGERRIGKTTLQHQLKRRLEALDDPAYSFYPVYIDLQGTPEDRFFATLAEEIFQELEPVLGGLEPRRPPSSEYGYRDLLYDLRAILKTLRAATDRRVRLVLLIDEVDELNSYDPRVNQKLRSLFMKSFAEDLVAVVSGVSIKREWDREGSPWYNFFEEIDVGPFKLDDARELIERPIGGVLSFGDGAIERIVELSDYRPYRIQRLCMKLVSRMYELGRRRITVEDVEAIGDPASRGAA